MPRDLEKILPEICYSNDPRGYALTVDGLNYLLRTKWHACWSTRGSVNFLKLKIFLILFEGGRLKYGKGEQDIYLGPMNLTDGPIMTGIPLPVGHEPKECLEKFKSKVNRILKAAGRTQPTYVLALRIILSFAVASPDYVFTVIPAKREWIAKHQILIKKIACAVLGIRKNTPNTWLYMPLSLGGYGIPEIETRFRLKCIAMWASALDCRNKLTKQATRYAWFTDIADTLQAWDPKVIPGMASVSQAQHCGP